MKHPESGIGVIPYADVSYLDKILLDNDNLHKAVPSSLLKDIPHQHLQSWAMNNGIYQIITTELIEFLKQEIGTSKAIEINAGDGCISRELDILGTDSYSQQNSNNEMLKLWRDAGFKMTKPPKAIKKYEALEAVRVFRPDTVVGAYVSQKGTAEEAARGIPSSPIGVNEMELLTKVKKYIHIGNMDTHAHKRIYAVPHRALYFDWLYNRSFVQANNRIWIWDNQ